MRNFVLRWMNEWMDGWYFTVRHAKKVSVFSFSPYLGVRGVRLSKLPFFFIDLLPGVSPLPAGPSMLPPGANN